MNWPPMLMQLRFPTENGSWGLWFPFFLVYPLLLAVSIIALPFLLLAALLMLPWGYARIPLLVLPYIWNTVFKLKGLKVDVEQPGHNVFINIV